MKVIIREKRHLRVTTVTFEPVDLSTRLTVWMDFEDGHIDSEEIMLTEINQVVVTENE